MPWISHSTTEVDIQFGSRHLLFEAQIACTKMMIPGCNVQVKRNVENFDEVLYNSIAEQLITETNRVVRSLLSSEDCDKLLALMGGKTPSSLGIQGA